MADGHVMLLAMLASCLDSVVTRIPSSQATFGSPFVSRPQVVWVELCRRLVMALIVVDQSTVQAMSAGIWCRHR